MGRTQRRTADGVKGETAAKRWRHEADEGRILPVAPKGYGGVQAWFLVAQRQVQFVNDLDSLALDVRRGLALSRLGR